MKYCKETGEDIKANGDCLIHGKQPESHFDYDNDNKMCAVCGKSFWCQDNIRKVCSMTCAGEYNNK